MRSQMRLAAALPLLKRFTGFTPGRLIQMATWRSAGQAAASSFYSFWLANDWDGSVAAASSGVANALMLLSASIVNVFIFNLLVPRFLRS
jgi:hypothetical protein